MGILVALGVNNWNEERKERTVEEKILKEIRSDLDSTLDEIEGDLRSAMSQRDATFRVLQYIE